MFYSGISDEAGHSLATQIQAHKELGWTHLELRLVDGTNVTSLTDSAFDRLCEALSVAEMKVSCFGSAIANWSRPITSDPQIDLDDLRGAVPRMHRLGTPLIRVMSYPNDETAPLSEREWRSESIRRMKALAAIAEDSGVTLCHENCSGWGGLSAENSQILLGEVDSPALKLVFDTGNPVCYGQDSWLYYQNVLDDIVYIHVKDARIINGTEVYTCCGDGDGAVQRILGDLLRREYAGGISIEPHLSSVIHTGESTGNADQQYASYISYGRRLMAIVETLTSETSLSD